MYTKCKKFMFGNDRNRHNNLEYKLFVPEDGTSKRSRSMNLRRTRANEQLPTVSRLTTSSCRHSPDSSLPSRTLSPKS